MARPLFGNKAQEDDNWISVSDLMAGLMMVFLFILIIYAKTADERLQNAQEIVVEWRDSELAIYEALIDEFESDLKDWEAIIEKETLTIRFQSPRILFETGKADLSPRFKQILDDFMPRYIDLLASNFSGVIEEVRIEGHTSSEWKNSSELEAFTYNMKLSQDRTRSVLDYSINLQDVRQHTQWMIKTVSANGLSSARTVVNKNTGLEDRDLSKRVEFKVKTKAQEALFTIIEKIAPEVKGGF